MNKDDVLLGVLINNEDLCRTVISYIKAVYFTDKTHKSLFKILSNHIEKYNKLISREILLIEASKLKNLSDDGYNNLIALYDSLVKNNSDVDKEWFVDFAETFCKERAVYNAVQKSIILLEEEKNIDQLPHIFEEAVGTSFDISVGHNYQKDASERFRKYKEKVEKIPTGWKEFDEATGGGFERKTLNVFMGGSGTGKSLVMISLASNMIRQGLNVLYITLELAEEKVARRFDANLLNVEMDRLEDMDGDVFVSKVDSIMNKCHGQLVIKEYPTSGANVNHFKSLLQELKQKTGFIPDAIVIDYINICCSSRVTKSTGSYFEIKAIAEELRGLAVQEDVVMVSATQSVRGSQESSDIALSDVSESYALVHTVDYMVGIMQTEDMAKQNKYYMRQLKSRYGDVNMRPFWFMGVNKAKMTVYDIESSDHAITQTVENIQAINNVNRMNGSASINKLKF